MDTPLVSVCMITYNHSNYITQAIEGVLMQEFSYEIELIISDDNSPDGTIDIVKNIIQNHKNGKWIKYFKHEQNMGAIPNFIWALKQCKGKYVALCDGDDYWIDTLKLQKQVDFLQKNIDYSASFHDVNVLYDDKIVSFAKQKGNPQYETFNIKDVLSNEWLIPTCSYVFRNDKLKLPPFFNKLNHGDFPLFCATIMNSKLHYTADIMSTYRRNNSDSAMNKTPPFWYLTISVDVIQFLTWLTKYLYAEYHEAVEQRINLEIEKLRKQTQIYKNSKFAKFYTFLSRAIKIN